MEFWDFIEQGLSNGRRVMLMVVVESVGSAPGRVGFKMAVDDHGGLAGSIGGG
jgi:xanthine dehydrogenase accessory factor